MTILTKAPITKGTPADFTIDVAELLLLPAVVADPYFSNLVNWKYVSLTYKSDSTAQHKNVLFHVAASEFVAPFKTSIYADDVYQIQSLTIHDFDGGTLLIKRSSLTAAEFDVSI